MVIQAQENQLFRGNRTTKVSSQHFDAFMSYNFSSLAEIGVNIKYNFNALLNSNSDDISIIDLKRLVSSSSIPVGKTPHTVRVLK